MIDKSLGRSRALRVLQILLGGLALAGSTGATALAGDSKPPAASHGCDYPRDCNGVLTDERFDLCNFHKVDAAVFRGPRPKAEDESYLKLAALGVRTVINLEEPAEAAREKAIIDRVNHTLVGRRQPALAFISFPISPFYEVQIAGISESQMRDLFQRIKDAPKPVFIHCRKGKDRTGAVVAVYRMRQNQLNYDDGYREAVYYRFNARFNAGLKKTIRRYRDPEKLAMLPIADVGPAPQEVCVGAAPMPSAETAAR
jgi:protein tyrosine phosphatase (PTP) superfamily phosphohydrolase (DUF442 family)